MRAPATGAVLATAETLAIMDVRMGQGRSGDTQQVLVPSETLTIGDVRVWMQPAGHVLGSAQIAMEHQGARAVVSGDYKRAADPTCAPFVPIPCDVFVTEATFGLPIFVHPPALGEARKLIESVRPVSRTHPRRRLLRAGQGAAADRAAAPGRMGAADLPARRADAGLRAIRGTRRETWRLAAGHRRCDKRRHSPAPSCLPRPSAIADRWARRFAEPVTVLASGWMRVRQRARAKGIELPLVISDHADWPELLATLDEVGAPEIWVTHGAEEALIHAA